MNERIDNLAGAADDFSISLYWLAVECRRWYMGGRVSGTLGTSWREALDSGHELLLAVSDLQDMNIIAHL